MLEEANRSISNTHEKNETEIAGVETTNQEYKSSSIITNLIDRFGTSKTHGNEPRDGTESD